MEAVTIFMSVLLFTTGSFLVKRCLRMDDGDELPFLLSIASIGFSLLMFIVVLFNTQERIDNCESLLNNNNKIEEIENVK
jgi:hypothetical protein